MENIIDYAKTELHTMDIKEFNDVDSLILSQLSYIKLDELIGTIDSNSDSILLKDLLKAEFFPKMFKDIAYAEQTKDLLFNLCSNPRFRNIKINYHISKTDPIFEKQFSATTFILNENLAYIAFRGTDYSIVGWKEDFNMAFTIPVPSQLEGVGYINKISKLIPHDFYVGGHSNGGNIAVYASMHCDFEASPRIKKIFSHDGPVFREEVIKSDAFIKMSKTLKHNIEEDLKKNIIAKWHDESQLNRYIVNKLGVRILEPMYCYPCGMEVSYSKKIYAVSKQAKFDVKSFKGQYANRQSSVRKSLGVLKRKLLLKERFMYLIDVISGAHIEEISDEK